MKFIIFLLFTLICLTACTPTNPENTNQAGQPAQHKIKIKAAIIYKLGGPQPVAREDFYLLSKDAVQIWKESGVLKDEKDFAIKLAMDRIYALDKKNPLKFVESIKPFSAQKVTTDFEGAAEFSNVADGDYYLFALTETRGGSAVWNYKISVKDDQTVLLDNKNAYYAD